MHFYKYGVPLMTNVGYLRVSSYSQNLDRQLRDIDLDKVFEEKASAKDTNRPQLVACMEWLRDADVLHVHSIDRLARNLQDLQHIVQTLTDKGVTIRFHKENLTFAGGTSDPMNTLMLQMMGAFSEFERSLINERRKEGMAAAKAAGKQIGAKRKLSNDDVVDIKSRIARGESKSSLAGEYSISRQTLYSALK
jgi:DNA invertase Pin-like site-specific DNA recombinase